MAKYLTEFIGTFFLVLSISLAVSTGQPLAGLAIGGTLMVMIYMGGHISGAHYNPAVTVAVFLRGAMPASDIVPYMGAQILGGTIAAVVGGVITGNTEVIAPSADYGVAAWLLVEILYTFALATVVLNVATVNKTGVSNNSYYGLAIGFTVVAAAIAGGGISGGAYNPAVGIGLTLGDLFSGGNTIANVWLYIVGPLIGGGLAGVVFKIMNADQ
ncbi:MAG: MIP/aquaporin family protein [Candidatus Promineifilaceae bacterium]